MNRARNPPVKASDQLIRNIKVPLAQSTAQRVAFAILLVILSVRIMERLFFYRQILPGPIFVLVIAIYIALRGLNLNSLKFRNSSSDLVLGLAVVFLPLSSIILQQIFLVDQYDYLGRSALDFSASLYMYGITWFLIGIIFADMRAGFSSYIYLTLLAATAFMIITNSAGGKLDYLFLREANGIEVFSHQWITESATILFFMAYTSSNGRLHRALCLVVVLVCLFLVGGRTALFFTFFAIIVFEFVVEGRLTITGNAKGVALLIVSTLIVITLVLFVWPNTFNELFLQMTNLQSDQSWQARSNAASIGVSLLPAQILFGDPTLLATELGNIGWYIHDIRSAWQIFGFPFFLVCLMSFFYSIRKMFTQAGRRGHGGFSKFRMVFLIYVVCISATTTYIGSAWIWFAIGLWLGEPQSQRKFA